ncbi:hypothetical protein MRX96_004223 [Rhipicephalus microplus]
MADKRSWHEALSRLDFKRDCSAGVATADICWLCDKLAVWNAVLAPLRLQVVEEIPGLLCLRTRQANKKPAVFNSTYNTAYFIAWLPRKHRCVIAVKFGQGQRKLDRSTVPQCLLNFTPEVRQVTIGGIGPFNCSSLMDSLGAVTNLEALVVNEATVGDPLSAALGELLVKNIDTVRTVSVNNSFIPSGASHTLTEAISRCVNLKELTYNAHLDFEGVTYLKNLIRSAGSLETLCLREVLTSVVYEADEQQNEELLATVTELARRSTLDFCYHAYAHLFTNALRGLEASMALRHLEISKCDCATGPTVGPLLKCALSSYAGLQSLTFRACEFDAASAELLAAALEQNTTLRQLLVIDVIISFSQMQTVLVALEKNKTLQLLQVDFLTASEEQRWMLSEQMNRNDLYTRVQLPWTNSDARYLTAVLGEPWLCPCYLQLNAGRLSDYHFAVLCRALSRSCFVRSLTVSLWQAGHRQVDSLRDALRKNTSIVELKLHDCECSGAAVRVATGLDVNRKVVQLVLICGDKMELSSAVQFASVLAANQFLSEVELMCSREVNSECMTAMSRGLLQNDTILSFAVRARCIAECSTRGMEAAVQRNVTRLHRAVRFVLKKDLAKPFAEAFEMFENKGSLIPRVMLASGMSEEEANAAVTTARRYIWGELLLDQQRD